VDIVTDLTKDNGRLDRHCLKTPLKKRTMGRAILSDAVGKCGLEPLHTHREVALRGFNGGMEMVLHDDIGVQQPSATLASRPKAFHESRFGRFTGEELLAVMASIEHVVDSPWVGQTKFARHAGRGNNLHGKRKEKVMHGPLAPV
jgi:hypothetical protein